MQLPVDLEARLARRSAATGQPIATLIEQLLRQALATPDSVRGLTVTAPVNALVEGIYQADTTVAELLEKGDFGLGTFNDLDGEMVLLDGTVYQLKSDGNAYAVAPETRTPYACVNFFSPDTEEAIDLELDFAGLCLLLDQLLPSPNMIYAIRIEGHFRHVRTRSVPRQDSYRPLVEVAREQPEFDYHDLRGVMTGYWTPTFMADLTVPGYHLHFLSGDRRHGGHVLACRSNGIRIGLQHLPRLEVGLPVSLDYLTAQFTRDLHSDLQEAEMDRGRD